MTHDEARALVAEGRQHDGAMTRAPWTTPIGTRFLGAVSAIIDGLERQVAAAAGQAPQFDDAPDVGAALAANAAGIAWMRTSLAALLTGYADALDEIERLRSALNYMHDKVDGYDSTKDLADEIAAGTGKP